MPDYASILRRSISALPDSSPEMREAVYERARAALARQLTAVDPPLSTREIEAQHQDLEDAVARLEADLSQSQAPPAPDSQRQPDEYYYPPPQPSSPVTRTQTPLTTGNNQAYNDLGSRPYDADEEDEEDEFDDEERASRTPILVGLALLVLVLIGAGAYAYAERDRLFAMFGSAPAENVANVEAPAGAAADPATTPVAPEAEKLPDRLINGTDAPPQPEPPPPSAPAEPDAGLAAVPEQPETPEPAAPLEPQETAGLNSDQPPAALGDPAQSIVEQRAIYYFQGAEGTPGQATNGNVTWAQVARDSGPAVQATLRLADQPVTTTVTIYKNTDNSLPASHLVEVQFSGQIGPTPVQRVPALVFKQTEQARGQPLTGAAVPVTNELFWIALSDDQQQVDRNLQLLREGSWFDIPILFNDGTRALLTFEKGIPGDKVFETAMAAWVPS